MIFIRTILICFIFAVFTKSDRDTLTAVNEEFNKNIKEDYEATKEAIKVLNVVEDEFIHRSTKHATVFHKNAIESDEASVERNINKDSNDNGQGAMEDSGLFQGDIMLSESQAKLVVEEAKELLEEFNVTKINNTNTHKREKRKISILAEHKWSFPIKYYVDSNINPYLIQRAINLIESETCATFVRTYYLEPYFPGIRYYYGKGCWSYLGKVEPYAYQGISLGRGCHYTGTAAHETLHALGLNHEQERVDRDQYIRVYFQNIKYGEESNFVKISALDTSTYNIKYDLGSLMQYDLYAFSDNGRKTMDTIERIYEKTPGQNERLSFADAKIVNLHYCTQKCINKISCYNGGYQNPKDCTKCKCPQGFHGKYCDEFPPQVSGCPSPCYNVKSEQQSIQFAGPVNCTVHLRTQVGRKIRMNINKSRFYEYNKDYFCYSFNTFEVKYFADKTVTGARFCGSDYNIPVASENHHIVLIFSSISRYSDAQVTFSSY